MTRHVSSKEKMTAEEQKAGAGTKRGSSVDAKAGLTEDASLQ